MLSASLYVLFICCLVMLSRAFMTLSPWSSHSCCTTPCACRTACLSTEGDLAMLSCRSFTMPPSGWCQRWPSPLVRRSCCPLRARSRFLSSSCLAPHVTLLLACVVALLALPVEPCPLGCGGAGGGGGGVGGCGAALPSCSLAM